MLLLAACAHAVAQWRVDLVEHRARRRPRLDRAVQPRVQGALRHHAVAVPAVARCGRRRRRRNRPASPLKSTSRGARGYRVRTYTSRPANAAGRLPLVVFIPWLSCGPVENPLDIDDGWSKMLRDVMREAGAPVVRIEKPGLSDARDPIAARATSRKTSTHFAPAFAPPWRIPAPMRSARSSSAAASAVRSRRSSPRSSR